ncbi:DUF1254 domain-containing protein [Rhizohabitans arisaemae]|uniref:DUF1254 domain-containing protein n=1 Tax=Rhizohabitans arisaemae TaxID=2720610 RepID=UPI0024B0D241|nr:DUF1254 domain-containing protein [Rhizohabitans arisaemae]
MPGAGERRLTPDVVREIARLAYLWAWPMVNLHNRLAALRRVPEPGLLGGVVPVAPVGRLCMLIDRLAPGQRRVPCPDPDVVYGFGVLDLGDGPVVVQVPDFGDLYWVYQLCDQRTDAFAELGAMYGSRPGLYLVVGPHWSGVKPPGFAGVLRSPTGIATVSPRLYPVGEPVGRLAGQVSAYPLTRFDGGFQTQDWSAVPDLPDAFQAGDDVSAWVSPATFFDVLPEVMDEVPPLRGEEAVYRLVRTVLDSSDHRELLREAAVAADAELIAPLLRFRDVGVEVADGWTTFWDGAAFGTDYVTRTAVARQGVCAGRAAETVCFFRELDSAGERLHGAHTYRVDFAPGELPPVRGFWSLTLYDRDRFLHPNVANRYRFGPAADAEAGLTVVVRHAPPAGPLRAGWLPAPAGDFALCLRAHRPEPALLTRAWEPPPVVRV